MRAFATSKINGTRLLPAGQVPGVWFGFGVYGPLAETHVGGWKIANTSELYGHTWQLTTTRTSSGAPLLVPAADYDRVATMVWASPSNDGGVEFRAGAAQSGGESSVGGGKAASPGLWAPAGAPVHVRMTRGTGTFGVGLYDRVD